jgi:uncharacterized membrane protein
MEIAKTIARKIPEILVGVVWLYVLIPFLAPLAYLNGYDGIGWQINQIYEEFCHQRVERSVFLFGEDAPVRFYDVGELKEEGAIPEVNPDSKPYEWPEYFGHDYVGNSEVGWKVPLCIRDIALYGSFALAGTIAIWLRRRGKKIAIPSWLLLAMLVPMAFDGVSLLIITLFKMEWVPDWYIASNLKRVITGVLFGSSLALLLIPLFFSGKKLTKRSENKRI